MVQSTSKIAIWLCFLVCRLIGSANTDSAGATGQATLSNGRGLPNPLDHALNSESLMPKTKDGDSLADGQATLTRQSPHAQAALGDQGEAKQADNHTPPVSSYVSQTNQANSNPASEVRHQASQTTEQLPVSSSDWAAPLPDSRVQQQPASQLVPPSSPGRQPPLPADQIQPTHTANDQMRPPVNKNKPPAPSGGRMPLHPPPPSRTPPPQGPPLPPKRQGLPSFLAPSSESNDAFDGAGASFVYILPSRRRQCFHHRSAKFFMFEFHVLHGGKLDINAYVVGPDGRIIYESKDRRQGRYIVSSSTTAANRTQGSSLPLYTVCLDNRYSSWYAKLVDFRIEISRPRRSEEKTSDPSSSAASIAEGPLSAELTAELERLNLSWTQFLELTDAVEGNLHQSFSYQRQFRTDETRDRMAMEDSASCVTLWSMLQLTVMIVVSGLQVLMIRALFDEKSVFHRLWKSRGAFMGRM